MRTVDAHAKGNGRHTISTEHRPYRIIGDIDHRDADEAGTYSMRVVQRLTGLLPDTIRVWERRYRAVQPSRTEGGTRRFTERDVRRLVLLRQAVERGHRIGAIAALPDEQLRTLVDEEAELVALADPAASELDQPERRYAALRERYVEAIMRFDAPRAFEQLATAAALLDRDAFLFQVLLPVLRTIGEAWEAGELRVAHEHLVSAQIRGLIDVLARQATPLPGAPKVIVTTPAGHQHEFGAAMAALLAASRGFHAIYLGPDLPVDDIKLAVDGCRAELVVLSVLGPANQRARAELAADLRDLAAHVDTWVGLPDDHPALGEVAAVRYFVRLEDYDAALAERAARRSPRRRRRKK